MKLSGVNLLISPLMKTAGDEMALYSLNVVALFHGCAACCHVTASINFFTTTHQTVTVSHEHEGREL